MILIISAFRCVFIHLFQNVFSVFNRLWMRTAGGPVYHMNTYCSTGMYRMYFGIVSLKQLETLEKAHTPDRNKCFSRRSDSAAMLPLHGVCYICSNWTIAHGLTNTNVLLFLSCLNYQTEESSSCDTSDHLK